MDQDKNYEICMRNSMTGSHHTLVHEPVFAKN